ncbi:MAG TPA: hypothetical protein VM534_10735 [Thermoanaerobaculia bacterium]|nr:hypothetical protein [Thermoanaerobaculia bacterium]
MKDAASRFIAAFLMAQLFPGALLVFSLCFLYFSLPPTVPASLYQGVNIVLSVWDTGSLVRTFAILLILMGAGMSLQGLHRAVLGAVERRSGSLAEAWWHSGPIWLQILVGPVQIVAEIFSLLFSTRGLREAAANDHAAAIESSRFTHLDELRAASLPIAEFFLHTSYALIGSCTALVVFMITGGVSIRRLLLLALLYLLTGLFFVLGRIEVQTFESAEEDLSSRRD